MKRVLSFMLVIFMLIGSMPILASADEFEPTKLVVDGYGSTTGFFVRTTSLELAGINEDNHSELVNCLISGTVTKADGTVLTLNYKPIISTQVNGEYIRIWVGELNIDNGWWNQSSPAPYTADLTLSPAVDFENFKPVTLDVQGYSETQGFMIGVSSLSSIGLTADDHEKLVGCLLSGTVTKDGTTITLINAPIISTIKSDASIIRLWVGAQNITNGWFSSTGYIANITLSPVPKENETDFEPVKINVSAVGSDGLGHKRFVIQNDFTFPITVENQLKGCVLNGIVTYTGSDEGISESVPFVNVPVVAQPMRTDGRISLDFTVPSGYAIKESSVSEYVFELTISPAIDTDSFAPFRISVDRTGTDGTGTKRLLIKNTLNIDESIENQLKGCYLNGVATYHGAGEYSKTVIFENVPIVAQPARTDGLLAIDFAVPDGYTLCLSADEDSEYEWDLTLSESMIYELFIKSITAENNSVALTIKNNTDSDTGELKLIAAVYNSNALAEMKIVDIQNIEPGSLLEVEEIEFSEKNWTFGKVFVWKSITNAISATRAIEFNNSALPYMEYYVSNSGSDSNAGTKNAPFKTLYAAQEAVRSVNEDMTGDIIVNVEEGEYYLDEMLDFGTADSGYNGHRVIWQGTDNEKPVISGGKKVTGFAKSAYEGIYVADFDSDEVILQLSVNGKRRYAAKAANLIKGVEKPSSYNSFVWYWTHPNDDSKDSYNYYNTSTDYTYDGFFVDKKDLAIYENCEDMFFVWDKHWVTNVVRVEKIEEEPKDSSMLRVTMEPGAWDNYRKREDTNDVMPSPEREFTAMNAFELLDEPGEFYYNRHIKKLYYMPYEDEDMSTATVIVPQLETLLTIDGNDVDDKVKNITFNNIHFADTKWDYSNGYLSGQATQLSGNGVSSMAPRAIFVERADGVEFTNNIISNVGGGAIDYYNGVTNSKIVGNAIYDIGESGILSGARNHSDFSLGTDAVSDDVPTEYENSAIDLLSIPTTKLYYSYYGYETDGLNPIIYPGFCSTSLSDDSEGGYYMNNVTWIDGTYTYSDSDEWRDDYSSAEGEKPYVMFEFLRPYSIDEVVVSFNSDITEAERSNFEILASNDKNFETYTVVATQSGAAASDVNHYTAGDSTKYKYVMIRKTSAADFALSRVWIASSDRKPFIKNERCEDIVIENNIVERAGVDSSRSIGLVIAHGKDFSVKHNEFIDIAYSGTSIGYTWHTTQNTCYNMDVGYNYVYDTCQTMHDGGGMYTLGAQPGSHYYNNRIERVNLGLNGYYTDNGTRYETIENNYIEGSLYMLSPYTDIDTRGIIENTFENNFGTHTISNDAAKNLNTYEDVKPTVIGQPQREAYDTYKNAGLEPEYAYLRDYIPVGRDNLYSRYHYYSVTNDNERSAWKDESLANIGLELKYTLDNGAFGDGLGMYPTEYRDKLEAMYNYVVSGTNADTYMRVMRGKDFHEELKASLNRHSYDETLAMCYELLAAAKGADAGNYPDGAADELEADIAAATNISQQTAEDEYDALVALETAYNTMKDKYVGEVDSVGTTDSYSETSILGKNTEWIYTLAEDGFVRRAAEFTSFSANRIPYMSAVNGVSSRTTVKFSPITPNDDKSFIVILGANSGAGFDMGNTDAAHNHYELEFTNDTASLYEVSSGVRTLIVTCNSGIVWNGTNTLTYSVDDTFTVVLNGTQIISANVSKCSEKYYVGFSNPDAVIRIY